MKKEALRFVSWKISDLLAPVQCISEVISISVPFEMKRAVF